MVFIPECNEGISGIMSHCEMSSRDPYRDHGVITGQRDLRYRRITKFSIGSADGQPMSKSWDHHVFT